jgi:YidC/Oxa1 family membrane protein insertase
MERRALLAAVLCLVVLVAYQEALRYFYPAPPEQAVAPQITAPGEVPSPGPPSESLARADEASPPPIGTAEPVVVETDLFTARIAPLGGRIASLRLKKYRTSVTNESEPLEMIQVGAGSASPLGVRLASEDGKIVEDDTKVTYAIEPTALVVTDATTGTLTLRGTMPSGATITKTLVFSGSSYPGRGRCGRRI